MIVRWLVVGIVLWLAVVGAFRFAGEEVSTWLLMTLPAAMLLVTHLFLRVFRVAETDRGEAASIMAVPGLLVGIYAINSFNFVFDDPSLTLPQFAALMFACYAAVVIAGLVSYRVVVGFLLWIGVAVAFRFIFAGSAEEAAPWQLVLRPGEEGVSWAFLVLPLAMLVITYVVLKILRVAETDRAEAASVLAVPGLLVGIYEINSFESFFPNLDVALVPQFAALMFACYAAVILAGIVSSRLESI